MHCLPCLTATTAQIEAAVFAAEHIWRSMSAVSQVEASGIADQKYLPPPCPLTAATMNVAARRLNVEA